MQEIVHRNARTGIKSVFIWHPDMGVSANHYWKDNGFLKAEVLGYADDEAEFKRLVERYTLDQGL